MVRLVLLLLMGTLSALPAGAEERRIALLIGNEDYPPEVGRLSEAHADITVLSQALQETGFQVISHLDLDEDETEDALSDFEERIVALASEKAKVVAFFYFSGHGASAIINGEHANYLIPAKEKVTNASQLARKGIDLEDVVSGLSLTGAHTLFVIADACRNNLQAAFGRSGNKGFTPTAARPGMFIAHSTYPGQTAPDDGAFARTLAQQIRQPGIYAERAFALTNRQVAATRGIRQIPTTASALSDDFCFMGCPGQTVPTAGVVPVSLPRQAPSVLPEEIMRDDFIFESSDRRLIALEDLDGMSAPQLRLARNEIFARKGRRFESPELVAYFRQFAWYIPRYKEVDLTSIESKNVMFILEHEKARR